MIDQATANQGPPCESCGLAMDKGALICTRCGFNRQLGKAVATRVLKAPKDPKAPQAARKGRSLWDNALMDLIGAFTPMFMITLIVTAALGAFASSSPEVGAVFFGVAGVISLWAYVGIVVGAFLDGQKGWGLALIILSVFGFGFLLVLWFIFMESERAGAKGAYFGSFIGTCLGLVVFVTNLPEDVDVAPPERAGTVISPPPAAPSSGLFPSPPSQ